MFNEKLLAGRRILVTGGGTGLGKEMADNLGAATSDRVEEKYPAGNYFVSSFQRIGFTDIANGDWRLGANSKTRQRASDGGDPGVDFEALAAAGALAARDGGRFEHALTRPRTYVR